ncbi:MAG: hypothetical protein ACPG5Z_02845 [Pseudoalteromonas sp.]
MPFMTAAEALTVRYTAGGHPYITELLKLVLSKSDITIKPIEIDKIPSQTRAIRLLGEQDGIDVFWTVTSPSSEKRAKAILIPLVKGLMGYRIALIQNTRQDLFSNVTHSGQLSPFTFGLRQDWPDTAIFQSNDLKTITYGQGADPLNMLTSGRFDALPFEIFDLASLHNEQVVGDQYIAIRYPSAVYFFVAKNNLKLHKLIESGLLKAIDDGSFEALFNQHFSQVIKQAQLGSRRIIELKNPLLPPSAPIHKAHYWLDKNKLKQ